MALFLVPKYIKLFWRFWHSCVIAPDFDGLDSTSYKAQSLSWKLVEKILYLGITTFCIPIWIIELD